jgi:hypothetical protein
MTGLIGIVVLVLVVWAFSSGGAGGNRDPKLPPGRSPARGGAEGKEPGGSPLEALGDSGPSDPVDAGDGGGDSGGGDGGD